jgi:hypothetical protein
VKDLLLVLPELAFWLAVGALVVVCVRLGLRLARALAEALLHRRGRDGW